MRSREIDLSVSLATGESLSVIRRHGFSLADPVDTHFDPEPSDVPPQWLDWDQVQAVEPVRPVRRRRSPVGV